MRPDRDWLQFDCALSYGLVEYLRTLGFPDGVRVENGYVTMPPLPGIGFEGKSELYRLMRELAE